MESTLLLIAATSSLALMPCCMRRCGPGAARALHALRARSPLMSTAAGRGRYVDSLDEAALALRSGGLVAFPTETVYGLGAHAFDEDAVARIFATKGRPRTDPLIVHVAAAAEAERLVRLGPAGLELMRGLAAEFWPGPLTIVAPAVAELPPAVTAGSGFVGVRCPAHAPARALLRAAAVPVAAPSANRFGHVSPTSAEHVMADLGAHPILVLRAAPGEAPCGVGIESTVVKVDEAGGALVLLRRGGVPEAALARWLTGGRAPFSLRAPPAPAPAAASAAPAAAAPPPVASGDAPQQAPGMLLTHYAPDVPSFLLAVDDGALGGGAAAPWRGAAAGWLARAAVVDYGRRAAALEPLALAYRDLSADADGPRAAAVLFETLRWAERQADGGARVILLPDLGGDDDEHVPALADRLYRAASGDRCRVGADGTLAGDAADAVLARASAD